MVTRVFVLLTALLSVVVALPHASIWKKNSLVKKFRGQGKLEVPEKFLKFTQQAQAQAEAQAEAKAATTTDYTGYTQDGDGDWYKVVNVGSTVSRAAAEAACAAEGAQLAAPLTSSGFDFVENLVITETDDSDLFDKHFWLGYKKHRGSPNYWTVQGAVVQMPPFIGNIRYTELQDGLDVECITGHVSSFFYMEYEMSLGGRACSDDSNTTGYVCQKS